MGWAHLSRGSGCPGHCPSPPRWRVGGGGLGVFACLYFHHEGCPVAQSGSCRAGSLLSGLCGAHPFLVPPASMCLVSPSETNGGQTPKSLQAQGGTPSSLEVEQRPGNCWLFFFFFLTGNLSYFGCFPLEVERELLEMTPFSIFMNRTDLRNNEHSGKHFPQSLPQ